MGVEYMVHTQLYLAVICILYVISSHFLKANAILQLEIQREVGRKEWRSTKKGITLWVLGKSNRFMEGNR